MSHLTLRKKTKVARSDLIFIVLLAAALGASSVFAWKEIEDQKQSRLIERSQVDVTALKKELKEARDQAKTKNDLLWDANQEVDRLNGELQSAQASITELEVQLSVTREEVFFLNEKAAGLEADVQSLTACIRDVSYFTNELNKVGVQDILSARRGLSTASKLAGSLMDMNQSWKTGTCQNAQAIISRYP